MKRGMTIEYLKCRADLNFEVDFGVNGAIAYTIVTIITTVFILLLTRLFGIRNRFLHKKYKLRLDSYTLFF